MSPSADPQHTLQVAILDRNTVTQREGSPKLVPQQEQEPIIGYWVFPYGISTDEARQQGLLTPAPLALLINTDQIAGHLMYLPARSDKGSAASVVAQYTTLLSMMPIDVKRMRIIMLPIVASDHLHKKDKPMMAVKLKVLMLQHRFLFYQYHTQLKTLECMGAPVWPGAERYYEVVDHQQDFNPYEMYRMEEDKIMGLMAVSHGRRFNTRIRLTMVDYVHFTQPTLLPYYKHAKQQTQMLERTIVEAKIAKSRGIEEFTYSDSIAMPKILADFNDGTLPKAPWCYASGLNYGIGLAHELEAVIADSRFKLPMMHRLTMTMDALKPSQLAYVTIAKVPAMGGFGVFAAQDIPAQTILAHYSGSYRDDHPDPRSVYYSFLNLLPGYIVSGNQAFYAFERGNITTLINQAPEQPPKKGDHYQVANTRAIVRLVNKIPFCFYETMRGVKKGEQLLTNYNDETYTSKADSSRFYFFSTTHPMCVTPTPEVLKYLHKDHQQGMDCFKKGAYRHAKVFFKQAYFQAVSLGHNPKAASVSTTQMKQHLAVVAEGLADCYHKLGSRSKALSFYAVAQKAWEALPITKNAEQRIEALSKKIAACSHLAQEEANNTRLKRK